MRYARKYGSRLSGRRAAFAKKVAARRIARFVRNRVATRRRSRVGRQVVHKFFRWQGQVNDTLVSIPGSTGPATPGQAALAIAYLMSRMAAAAELSVLYDQYKIVRTYLRMSYNWNPDDGGGVGAAQVTGQGPEVLIYNDYDDSTVPANYDDVVQVSRMKRKRFHADRPVISWKCRPKPLREVYRSAVSTAYENPTRAPWLDMSSTDIPHYGTKLWFINPSPMLCVVRISVGYKVLCRGVR